MTERTQILRIMVGDCVSRMKEIPGNSVAAVACDPPYGIDFMNRDWDSPWEEDGTEEAVDRHKMVKMQDWHVQWLSECFRVLQPGGYVKASAATRTSHRLSTAMEKAGFVLGSSHSVEAWLYGSGFSKSMNLRKFLSKSLPPDHPFLDEVRGFGTLIKPAWEPFIVGRKPHQ